MVPSEAPPRGCTGESPPTGQVAREGNFASINRLNLREAEQLLSTLFYYKVEAFEK
jgi:hypothetical protein